MFRSTTIGLALVAAVALQLAGCGQPVPPALKPLSKEARALLAQKGMREDAPIFVRIFKEESELEVWKLRDDGQYALFKTYGICRWSGDLGPKEHEGDRQAPEGFYQVRAGQMNPNSNYYLSFNIGYPNKYDQAYNRTGAHLMVHGDCKSAGCYAMTDAQIEEIYILAREAFKGGQDVFQVHAFPFRLTDVNLAAHRGNKWYGFWMNLREGYNYFERVHRPPEVQVCERRYLVNASFIDKSRAVDPRGACPRYQINPIELLPRPYQTQEAKAPRSVPRSTGSLRVAAKPWVPPSNPQTPAFVTTTTAAQASLARPVAARQPAPASTPAAQASLLARPAQAQAAQPSNYGQVAAQPQQQQQPAVPTFSTTTTPAAQATVGQGTTFQYAPTYPSDSTTAYKLNTWLGR